MKISEISIRRPVFTTMVIGALVVFGIVLYTRLKVDRFPDVDFPVVTVTVVYPGASPETLERQVAKPLEESINSLSGIRTLRSTSVESVVQVVAEFELGVDLDAAVQDVRDKVAAVKSDLPDAAEEPVVEKLDLGAAPVLQLAVSSKDPRGLAIYVQDTLKPELERVAGVGQVEILGNTEREVQVELEPDALRAYGLTANDVVGALGHQNIEVPGGRIDAGRQELGLRTDALYRDASKLGGLTVASVGGKPIYLHDVAKVVDGFEEKRSDALLDGRPAVGIVLRKQSVANTVKVADAVHAALGAIRSNAPAGTEIDVVQDNSTPIRASIESVQFDLVLGAFLAIAIILVFLRDLRATLISALALPTSVIGTFGFVAMMGFTLNLMTTLALSLSIGILIDDAIVVIENIVRRRTVFGEGPMEAAERGTAEIGLAVLATTFSIVAVFVPVAFMQGMIGQFFYQFGLTVAVAVLLSLFVSFTLTPMLSARFLKPHHGAAKGISGLIERRLDALDHAYRGVIRGALRHRGWTLVAAVVLLIGTFMLVPLLGFEFIPIEDQSQFNVRVELPVGSSLGATEQVAEQLATKMRSVPGVTSTFTTVGGGAQEQVNLATVLVQLLPMRERAFHQTAMMAYARELFADVPGARISVEPVDTTGTAAGRNAQLQLDLRGTDLAALDRAAKQIEADMKKAGGYVDVDTSARGGKPELRVDVRRDVADDLGLVSAQIAGTVRTLVAGTVATQIETSNDRVDVRVRLADADRGSIAPVLASTVRTPAGRLVEIGSVAKVERVTGPSRIDRQARQRQVSVYANLDGKPLGDAMTETARFADAAVTGDMVHAFGGTAQLMEESMHSMLFSLFLAVICVYMILAAQFESFVHPFTIMVSLPFSLIGAFGALLLTGQPMSIFAMIGLIMLFGLVTKNAILLVEFANQLHERGEPLHQALENAGAVRLRPILMTTAAMVLGMLPVAIGHGEGGEVRAPMGVAVIGGLLTSTLLTLIVVPVVYSFIEGGRERVRALARRWGKDDDARAAADVAPEVAQ